MYTIHVVRPWRVIAAEVSEEPNHDQFEKLLKELSEALNAVEDRKLKAEDLPKIPKKKILRFPVTPSL